jgi:3-oxoacyl-[acyl-carrier protein] reductase
VNLGLNGKTIIVTGGGGGIGRATAVLFAAEGARVVVVDIDETAVEGTAAEIRQSGAQVLAVHADASESADIDRFFVRTIDTFGTVDVLVNNAAIYESTPVEDLRRESWERVLAVNLTGVFLSSQRALQHMKIRRQGAIVMVASLAGQIGGVHAGAHYAAAKGGVIALTKALAKQAGPFGVRVNCVNPGVIDTRMTQSFPVDVRAAIRQTVPLGRWGRPDEAAAAIVFVASDAASFVHGAHLDVNGGIHMA